MHISIIIIIIDGCDLSVPYSILIISSSSSSSSYRRYKDGRLGHNPTLGLPFSRDGDGDDACSLPFMPFVNNQRDKQQLSSHAIHSAIPEALHSGFGFYQQPPHHHHPHHHHPPPPPHHHHQLSYQMPGFYPDNTIHRDWPIQYHNPSDYAAADDPSNMMMMNPYAPTDLDPIYHCCSYLDSDYPVASARGPHIPTTLSSHYPHMILYVAPPMAWSNIY